MFEFHLFAASPVYFNVSPRRDEGIAPRSTTIIIYSLFIKIY